jgi:hypothetical protein
MCTLTWKYSQGGYELHFNRDESRVRVKATPPSVLTNLPSAVIAPRDPEAGGTWICVNQYGVSLCILNNYRPAERYIGSRSRGLLVDALNQASTVKMIYQQIEEQDRTRFSPFDLFAFQPDGDVTNIRWDGLNLVETKPTEAFMTSSGFDPIHVIAGRKTQFSQQSSDCLYEFHRSHQPSRSANSVCMHRPDAKTLSYSRITVDEKTCRFFYANGSPCSTPLAEPLVIQRA